MMSRYPLAIGLFFIGILLANAQIWAGVDQSSDSDGLYIPKCSFLTQKTNKTENNWPILDPCDMLYSDSQTTLNPFGEFYSRYFSTFLGFGLGLPEVVPVEFMMNYHNLVSVRAFYVPTVPFKIRIEYPRGVLASQDDLTIENPDLNITFDSLYGPQLGTEILIFPFL